MDSILPALFAVAVLVLASLMLGRSGFNSIQVMGDSWQAAEDRTMERVRSEITITSINVLGPNVDVVVRNDGATEIVDFSRMDVVVQYEAGGTSHIRWMPYTTNLPQANNTWRVLVISDDVISPGVLNTGESMTLRVRLNPAVGTGTSNWLQVTTELGISASLFFTN